MAEKDHEIKCKINECGSARKECGSEIKGETKMAESKRDKMDAKGA